MVFVLDPLIATGGTAGAALGMITEWGIPSAYAFMCRGFESSFRDFLLFPPREQDQVALYLGFGGRAAECVGSVSRNRSRCRVICTVPFLTSGLGRYGQLLLILT
jgi:hypothetical protein